MPELSGEQKLRIVLESIIRKVPKEEQCQKYGISEEEFLGWQDQLTKNGGQIFEPGFGSKTTSRRPQVIRKMGPVAKVFLTLSLFANIGLITVAIVLSLNNSSQPPEAQVLSKTVVPLDSPLHSAQPDTDFSSLQPATAEVEKPLVEPLGEIKDLLATGSNTMGQQKNEDLETLLAKPMELPVPQVIPPTNTFIDVSSEVSFLDKIYEGRHVVYILDVGDYVLKGEGAAKRFEQMKDAVLSSIVTLSPNSYFNLVLYWNLRETSALGKTILKANRDNIKYAIDWISGLGSSLEDLKENRNQFVPKELLYSKPLPGVVGPWFGLGVGITFDPDLIFILSGNTPAFPMGAVPKSHFNGLDLSQRSLLNGSSETQFAQPASLLSGLTRQTARKWLVSMEPPGSLPENVLEIEKIAIRRLGLSEEFAQAQSSVSIPWEKVFENFLSSLEVNSQMIPQTNFFLCMPPHIRWPNDLFNTASEFAESSKGVLMEDPKFP
ncbi:MAG: hypothetical protein P8N49_00900 [Opitutales bacterium]|nr:hypothetical protein [Opitutales bacterium]